MSKYYEHKMATADAEQTPSPTCTGDQGEPSYMLLPSKYGLDNMEIGIGIFFFFFFFFFFLKALYYR